MREIIWFHLGIVLREFVLIKLARIFWKITRNIICIRILTSIWILIITWSHISLIRIYTHLTLFIHTLISSLEIIYSTHFRIVIAIYILIIGIEPSSKSALSYILLFISSLEISEATKIIVSSTIRVIISSFIRIIISSTIGIIVSSTIGIIVSSSIRVIIHIWPKVTLISIVVRAWSIPVSIRILTLVLHIRIPSSLLIISSSKLTSVRIDWLVSSSRHSSKRISKIRGRHSRLPRSIRGKFISYDFAGKFKRNIIFFT